MAMVVKWASAHERSLPTKQGFTPLKRTRLSCPPSSVDRDPHIPYYDGQPTDAYGIDLK